MHGPSPYAVQVLRAILHRPMTVPQIEAETTLAGRTVRAQLEALRKAGAVHVAARTGQGRRAGAFAIYAPVMVML